MKRRTQIALVLVATLLIPSVAMAAVTGSPDLSAHLSDNRVTPGEEATLGIVIQNTGELNSSGSSTLNSEVTTARGVTVDVNDGKAPISVNTATQAIGNVPEGATDPIEFQIDVEQDAEPGTYRVPVDVEYEYYSAISENGNSRNADTEDERFYVTLEVRDEARFEVVNVSSGARVGETGTVALTVENTGSEAAIVGDLTVTADNTATTFQESESAVRYFENWSVDERRTLTYRLNTGGSADSASYSFQLSGEYEGPDGQTRTSETERFGITPHPEQSFAIEGVESTLRVGDEGHLRGQVENTANTTVENVVIEWVSEQQNVSPSETEYAVGTLGPGESTEIDFEVEISDGAGSGPRQVTFVADYRDSDGDAQRSDEIDVQAAVEPSADEFEVEVTNASLEAGSGSQITLQLTNAGEQELTDISAQVFASSPISTTDSESFVSSLGPGESTELTFGVAAASGALEKQYPLSLDFQYEEPDGDTSISDSYRFAVDVAQPEESGGSPLPLIVVGLVVVALVVGYLRYYR